MKLRPYHNPENVDESKVPDGWRFRYADEAGTRVNAPCRAWWTFRQRFCDNYGFIGNCPEITYIVPVTP